MRPLGWCVRVSVGIISGTIGQLHSAAIELYLDLAKLGIRIVCRWSVGEGVIRGTVVERFTNRAAHIVTLKNLAASLFCHFFYRAPLLEADLRLGIQVVFVRFWAARAGEARTFRSPYGYVDSGALEPTNIHREYRYACWG